MFEIFILFASQFIMVFVYGVQSQTVRLGAKAESFILSSIAGLMSLVAFKVVPDATVVQMIAFVMGGAVGIVCSIYAHQHWYFLKYGKVENSTKREEQ